MYGDDHLTRKELTPLRNLNEGGSNLLFVDEQDDNREISQCQISLSLLKRIGGQGRG